MEGYRSKLHSELKIVLVRHRTPSLFWLFSLLVLMTMTYSKLFSWEILFWKVTFLLFLIWIYPFSQSCLSWSHVFRLFFVSFFWMLIRFSYLFYFRRKEICNKRSVTHINHLWVKIPHEEFSTHS